MKKFIAVGIIVLFVGAGIIPSSVGFKKEKTNYIHIKSGGYIQDLIDNASDGDTIYIPSGTYYENIIINKSISLIGEDKDTTIIDAGQEYGWNVVHVVSADWVNISNFTITNSSSGWFGGIDIYNSNYVKIERCNITWNSCSDIYIGGSKNISIIGNEISYAGDYGIYIGSSIDCKILNNYIYEVWVYGVTLYNNKKIILDNNTISNCYAGLLLGVQFDFLCDNIFSNNSFLNTGVSFDRGFEMGLFENNTFLNNTVNGKPLIYLENESDIVINEDAGQVILFDCNNIIVQNQELSNTTVGIILGVTNNCFISNNTISSNILGVEIWESINNTILRNIISNNYYGINLKDLSLNNLIYHNNIINNTKNALDECDNNTWDDGKYGNFWSDYKEKYPKARKKPFKGIWDTPYEIPGGDNKDNCPLIKQWPDSRTRTIPRNKVTFNYLFHWFLERITNIFPILRHINGLY